MFERSLLELMRFQLTVSILFLLISNGALLGQSNIWVGSWSCAPYAAGTGNTPPSPYLENNSLRQVVRVSIGGDTLRVKFSNKTSSTPVTMKSVNIAVSTGGSTVDKSSITPLTFNKNSSVTMDAFSWIMSDPVAFKLEPNMRIAITIHYGEAESAIDITSHVASRTDSYILVGDQTSSADFNGAEITAHWFHINAIDVRAANTAGSVGVLGNSITDGYGLSGGLQNRWTDFFSQELLSNPLTNEVGVLNLGIGGTNVTGSGATTGISRFKEDLLSQSGLRWIIIFYGTNDIAGGASATTITDAYQKMIDEAHARNIKVYGATITPFKGSGHYSEARETVRNAVNNWIRKEGNFDAHIDFDKAIRDPNDPSRLLAQYSNDWLHPNAAGYEFLGKSVDLHLFTEVDHEPILFALAGPDQTLVDNGNKGSRAVNLDGSGSFKFGNEVGSYIWSIDGSEVATGKNPTITLDPGIHFVTLAVADIEGNSATDEVVIRVIKDSGVWLEAECGVVGSEWYTETHESSSNNQYLTVRPGNNSTSTAPDGKSGAVTYEFNISESGIYTLYARVICPNSNDDSFWLKMDNGPFAFWNGIGPSATWVWANYYSTYNLDQGSHTLTIGYREDGAKLDKLWITKQGADLFDEGSVGENCGS